MSTCPLRLPRRVESDPRLTRIIHSLTAKTRLLWSGGEFEVPVITLSNELATALRRASSVGRVIRGLEKARHRLADEHHGLILADRRSGAKRGMRVSRLILITEDGADRFYRAVDSLLRKHCPRILAARLDVDAATLGGLLFGPDKIARLIMIEHKDAVSEVLFALAGQGRDDTSGTIETES